MRPGARAAIAASITALGSFACSHGPATANAVTFSRDVAPILFANCAPCHHPGGPGPLSLLSYDVARKHARQIAKVTTRRYMPPWLPEPGYGRFAGERHLSDEQIATLARWAEQSAPEGDPGVMPR